MEQSLKIQFLVPLVVVGVFAFYVKHLIGGYKALLQSQASRRRGTLHFRHLTICLEFPVEDKKVEVWMAPQAKVNPPQTIMKSCFSSSSPFKLTIIPRSIVNRIGLALGMKDIQTGNALLDQAFILSCSDENLARTFLTAEINNALIICQKYKANIAVHSKGFLANFHVNPKDDQELEDMVSCAVLFIKRIKKMGF